MAQTKIKNEVRPHLCDIPTLSLAQSARVAKFRVLGGHVTQSTSWPLSGKLICYDGVDMFLGALTVLATDEAKP